MDIKRRIEDCAGLTPHGAAACQYGAGVGRPLARLHHQGARAYGECINSQRASLLKKLGLEGFKELKVELARSEARRVDQKGEVDINFPLPPTTPPTPCSPKWPRSTKRPSPTRGICSTPSPSSTPPNCSTALAASTSTRSRTTCTQRRCSAIACSPLGAAPRASKAASARHA